MREINLENGSKIIVCKSSNNESENTLVREIVDGKAYYKPASTLSIMNDSLIVASLFQQYPLMYEELKEEYENKAVFIEEYVLMTRGEKGSFMINRYGSDKPICADLASLVVEIRATDPQIAKCILLDIQERVREREKLTAMLSKEVSPSRSMMYKIKTTISIFKGIFRVLRALFSLTLTVIFLPFIPSKKRK